MTGAEAGVQVVPAVGPSSCYIGAHLQGFFGNETYADCRLRFYLPKAHAVGVKSARRQEGATVTACKRTSRSGPSSGSASASEGMPSPPMHGASDSTNWLCEPLPAHRIILAMSNRLKAQLDRWAKWRSQGPEQDDEVLPVPLDSPEELQPAMQVR